MSEKQARQLDEVRLFRAVEYARSLSRDFPIADACRWAAQESGFPGAGIERYVTQAELNCARAAAALARAKLKRVGADHEGEADDDE